MAYKIKWTENAVEDMEHIMQYLLDEWSHQNATKFLEQVFYKIEIIKSLPFTGKQSAKKPGIRKILITKHCSIYYQLKEDVITILDIFDHRQDPKKSIFE